MTEQQEIYYKATRANGVSGRDSSFVYHLGLNVHPNPDKKSKATCGEGIHLAKTIIAAKKYVPNWKEIYEAKAGVILGEDDDKIRVTHCFLLRRISPVDITYPKRPSLCDDWVNKHARDITPEMIASQTLEISNNGKRLTLNLGMKKKDRKYLLKGIVV